MDLIRPVPRAPSGLPGTLRAFLGAGAACGLLFGLVDGIVAAIGGAASPILPAVLGCIAGAVFQYVLAGALVLGALALPLHPLVARKGEGARWLLALRIGLAVGIFAELFWWTRPYVFYGRSSTSPERLAAGAGMLLAAAAI